MSSCIWLAESPTLLVVNANLAIPRLNSTGSHHMQTHFFHAFFFSYQGPRHIVEKYNKRIEDIMETFQFQKMESFRVGRSL